MRRLLTFFTYTAPLFAFVFIIAQIVISNQVGILGKDLAEIEANTRQETILHQNLATQVASESSMLALEIRAKAFGFREPGKENIVVLDTSIPVAFAESLLKP